MPASCVLFCSIPLSELVGRVKPPRVRLHSPAVRASIEGLAPLRRIASQISAPQCGFPLRGSRPYGGLLRKLPPTPMGGKRESLWIGGVGGRLTQCPPTDTLFQVSVPKSWAKILGCKEEFLSSPAKPFKERQKNKKSSEAGVFKGISSFLRRRMRKKRAIEKDLQNNKF